MSIEEKISKLFSLNSKNWMRHSNPWSGFTRLTIVFLFVLAFWSRAWVGNYYFIFVALAIIWTFLNPLVFSKPKSTKNWMSKGVLGERIWIKRKKVKLPVKHKILPTLLNILGLLNLPFLIYGLYSFDLMTTSLSVFIMILIKFWFLDRMVWIYEDMKHTSQEYKSWEY